MTRPPGSEEQAQILAALRAAGAPLSATDVREIINRGRPEPLVAEQLYRRLAALQRHGLVQRVQVAGAKRLLAGAGSARREAGRGGPAGAGSMRWWMGGVAVSNRRVPWLSGLIVASLGAVWMIGQVLGGIVGLVGGLWWVHPVSNTTLSARIADD